MTRRRHTLALALALLALLLVAGCSGDDEGSEPSETETAVAGGAQDLPGPLPEGVEFEASEDGVAAPDFTTELVDGTSVTASDLWEDRPLVLVFTASWCETCADIHRDAAGVVDGHDGAVSLLGVVNQDDADGGRAYAEELALGYPLAVGNPDIWLNYAAREPPLVVLIGPGGEVVRGWPGGAEPAALTEAIDEIVADSGGR